VADAPNAEDPPPDAKPPTPPTARANGRPRTVTKTFRVSAVWRPPHAATEGQAGAQRHEAVREAGVRLSDEEVVYGLLTKGKRFEDRALADAQKAGVTSVTLQEVRPGGGVAAQIVFGIRVKGTAVAVVAGLAPAVMAGVAEALTDTYGQPVAVSAVPEAMGAPAPTTADSTTGWDRLAPLLGAIVTGVGVIGFVTFIGGVTVYARLRAAGFPAAPALGIFPSQDLVVIGAQTLVPEALWALGFVVALGFLYALVRRRKHVSDEEALLEGHWMRVAVRKRLRTVSKALRRARNRVSDEEAALLTGHVTPFATIGMFCFVVLALSLSIVPFWFELDNSHRLYAGGLILVAALLAATVGSLTRRFLYLATTTFLLVGVFLSFTAYWREGHANEVRGAAIIRDNKKAIKGLFVAEGAGRVYIARVNLIDEPACQKARGGVPGCQIIDDDSRLVGISKDEVTDIAMGDPKAPWRALEQARHLARELCDLQVTASC
jgi:hypothetical protein